MGPTAAWEGVGDAPERLWGGTRWSGPATSVSIGKQPWNLKLYILGIDMELPPLSSLLFYVCWSLHSEYRLLNTNQCGLSVTILKLISQKFSGNGVGLMPRGWSVQPRAAEQPRVHDERSL